MKTLREKVEKLLAQITTLRRLLILQRAERMRGIDFTDDRIVPDTVACVFAVTTLLYGLGLLPKIEIGTYTFGHKLLTRQYKNWVVTDRPEPACIAIAMTGTGIRTEYERRHGDIIGHCWIVGNDGLWYSNNSYDGLWSANYTEESAKERYETRGGMKIYYFKYISVL